jgi:hypothetical protein
MAQLKARVRDGRDILPYRGVNLIAEEQMQEVPTWDLRSMHPLGEIFAHPFLFLIVFFFLFLPAAPEESFRRTGPQPSLVRIGRLSRPKSWCLLVLRVQVLADGQQAHQLAARNARGRKLASAHIQDRFALFRVAQAQLWPRASVMDLKCPGIVVYST